MFQRNEDFNIILASDGYKVTHWKQYPPGTQTVYSYLESRGGKFPSTIFFGLQYYMKRYLEGIVVTQEKIDEAEVRLKPYIGDHFNREGWEYIFNEHGGRLPVKIKAVAEGTDVYIRNVLMTIENTDSSCFWLPNYLETMLVEIWHTITVATYSNYFRRMLLRYLRKTGSDAGIDYMLHDFGYRGVSSQESAGLGGAAHLVNFCGTDTIAGMELLREYYGAENHAASIPASEHSTITSWGQENEVDAFENMLDRYSTGPVACVSDSFNIWQACEKLWGERLRMKVLSRDGVLVIRPDSGDPPSTVAKCICILGERFGVNENDKRYKVLNPHVRLIQGDGVDLEMAEAVLDALVHDQWAAENIAFGSGGGLLQKHDRDTQQFAFKCSAIEIDDVWQDVWKDPITDKGKKSKRGRLRLDKGPNGVLMTISVGGGAFGSDQLQDVFLNGEVLVEHTLDEVRERARAASDND